MIDIHSHILFGVDDGAQTVEDSIAMARQAVEQGITAVFATPHHRNGKYTNEKNSILPKVEELNAALVQEGISLEVLPGQECRIFGELVEDYQKGEILTLNDGGKYVLIEFSSSHVPMYASQLLYNIQFEGIIPIIVHPERNSHFIERPESLSEFVEKGALVQLTAASVTGAFGKKIQKFSTQLLEANLVHFVASDAHNTTSRNNRMKEAFEVIAKNFDSSYVDYLQKNAELLVRSEYIPTRPIQPIKRKRLLGMF